MSANNRRVWIFAALVAVMVLLGGCNERDDKRNTDEKTYAPQPDFKTRLYMACPQCGCPQRPYRINELKSFYRCSGNPPKFPYHPEHLWQHTMTRDEAARLEF